MGIKHVHIKTGQCNMKQFKLRNITYYYLVLLINYLSINYLLIKQTTVGCFLSLTGMRNALNGMRSQMLVRKNMSIKQSYI